MVRLVIDTDPGVDDTHAIMMALAHPQARVEAFTTVAGNVPVELTTANACRILDILGFDIPVYAGAGRALVARNPHAEYVHGQDGFGNSGYPPSSRKVETEHAANALIRLGKESPGELTLVALGPLTNLALAIRLDPDLPGRYKRLVMMGGAIKGQGNTTPVSEFNIYQDPEAAAIVYEAWKGATLVAWEPTMAHVFSQEQVESLLAMQTARAELFRRITGSLIVFIEQMLGHKQLFAPDFLAMAAAIEPEVVTDAQMRYVDVELQGPLGRGQTVVDWMGTLRKEANLNLALEFNRARLWELFRMGLE